MVDPIRAIAIGGFFGGMVAWAVIAPQQVGAVTEGTVEVATSTIDKLFPEPIDPRIFRRYDITIDDTVSTEIVRQHVIRKIAGGEKSDVTVVTTPSGTYSTDGLASPHVQYPGVDKRLRRWGGLPLPLPGQTGGHWMSFTNGSFIYYAYVAVESVA
ncbi:MAG TPA: hypothetical protein VFE52_00025 [Devosia sp.]|jgi:hypothetical protein|nr:hypothetical protein [Devosia sp.]